MLFTSALSWAVSYSASFTDQALLFLHTSPEVANFIAICASLPIGQSLSHGMAAATIFACLLCRHICLHVFCRAVLVCALYYFEFNKLLHLSEAVHDGRLGFLHLEPLWPGQHIFAGDYFISHIFASSLIISPSISVSFKP